MDASRGRAPASNPSGAYPEPVPAPLLIADVPWLLYRSFFALPKSIVGADGQPVNALLGTINAILTFYDARLSACPPDGVVACMGAEEAAYRVKLYPPYHAHREPMPPELRAQWLQAPALLESFGWTYATSDELEADDVMFSFAREQEQHGGRALLLTGDRDLYGAVSERVAVAELKKGPTHPAHGEVGPMEVRERYGVEPEQVPDFIALRGDPSDGLPGAPGIGAKTAAELLRTHGTLEALLSAAGADAAPEDADAAAVRASRLMRPRIAATLRENAELLLEFKQIATLQRIDVELPRSHKEDFAAGALAARELGMKRLAERLEGMNVVGAVHGRGGQARDTGSAFVKTLNRRASRSPKR
jgi:5'-3' exonuclease